ncbi:MAG: single-stranded-DNA-specific exonuclease RecJ [Anaerolineaceae bacterium]|nr:single-stranded-DNA-specific exonuclease RecJ [Anaerolineaceae bacterium]
MSTPTHFITQWKEPAPVVIPEALRQAIAGPDLLLETLVRRGFSDPDKARGFLYPDEYIPTSGLQLPGMEKAIARIRKALDAQEKIGIWGDFDVDGQTSTSILVGALRKLGADVSYHIPIRASEGHGILWEPLQTFLSSGVTLLITCDTGISANEPIAQAMQTGVDVIVTDHHTLPETLPAAFAIVDPQLVAEDHPLRTLSGSGVAYKVVEQLFFELGQPQAATEFVDLAAFGLIADVATLTQDARYLVQRGLQQMRNAPRPAFARIFSDNSVSPEQINEETISFTLAPRMNAVGRLSDANPMVEFLLTQDPVLIATTTNRIEGLNSERKLLCDQVFRGALAQIEQNPRVLDSSLLLLAHPGWPGGVVGIVASRMVELYHRPAILMNVAEGVARGSARSIDGVNVTQALVENKHLLNTFGGHPMAAGMATPEDNIDQLRRGLSRSVDRMMLEENVQPTLEVDAIINLPEIDLDLLDALNLLAPFGPGNPPLQFAAPDLELMEAMPIGKTKEHQKMIVQSRDGSQNSLLWWQSVELPRPLNRFDLLYKARINHFRNKTEVQFEWVDYRERLEESTATLQKRRKKNLVNLDMRNSANPLEDLEAIRAEQDVLIWAEGLANLPEGGKTRTELSKQATLVIWTQPPSPRILEEALQQVKPQKIYWFANQPVETELKELIRNCFRLVNSKLASQSERECDLNALAGSLATTPRIVWLALKGLQMQGQLSVTELEAGKIKLSLSKLPPAPGDLPALQQEMLALHRESTAYRELFTRTAVIAHLLPQSMKAD